MRVILILMLLAALVLGADFALVLGPQFEPLLVAAWTDIGLAGSGFAIWVFTRSSSDPRASKVALYAASLAFAGIASFLELVKLFPAPRVSDFILPLVGGVAILNDLIHRAYPRMYIREKHMPVVLAYGLSLAATACGLTALSTGDLVTAARLTAILFVLSLILAWAPWTRWGPAGDLPNPLAIPAPRRYLR